MEVEGFIKVKTKDYVRIYLKRMLLALVASLSAIGIGLLFKDSNSLWTFIYAVIPSFFLITFTHNLTDAELTKIEERKRKKLKEREQILEHHK